jgi:hypothetical protein
MNLRAAVILLAAMASFVPQAWSNDRFADGLDIPTYPRLPLEERVPLSKSHSTVARVWEKGSRCWLKVGQLPEFDTELTAPCDIQTRGSSGGFAPDVTYNSASDAPADVAFEIVGGLKYYPKLRGECGATWRMVKIKWDAAAAPRQPARPRIELSPVTSSANSNGTVRCPRAYVEIK